TSVVLAITIVLNLLNFAHSYYTPITIAKMPKIYYILKHSQISEHISKILKLRLQS
ncbi:unnamed protein product, partial [Callosobruchus maculatus]